MKMKMEILLHPQAMNPSVPSLSVEGSKGQRSQTVIGLSMKQQSAIGDLLKCTQACM